MAPGTRGKVGPLNAWRPQAATAADLRHLLFDSAIETPPAEYGLAMLASSGKSDIEVEADVETDFPCGPARLC